MADAHAFTFGIEEEYFLVDPRTRNVAARVPRHFLKACRKRLGDVVSPELLQSQVEIASPILRDCGHARETMLALRRGVGEVAQAIGLRLMAAGTHPLAAWSEQHNTDKPRYARLMDDFQILGRRNVFCGLHVHVAVPPGHDRVQLMNRAMRWLPLFLALSTSSPFWNRQRTGLLSYRQAGYDEWPRTGIPDAFVDEVDYMAFAARLERAGAIRDASYLWWAIRPALRYPTLELRIADCCTELDDALAIAALYRCLLRLLLRRPEVGTVWHGHTRRLIDENRWRAKRHGIEASFIDEDAGGARPATAWLDELLALVADDARALACESSLRRLRTIVACGTSAHAQLARYAELRDAGASRIEALRGVVDDLVQVTVPTVRAAAA
ncbi:MAG: carboxylate-amine ligase [Xanthomonadaceae bacterium]|jgi:carboxylate-amine ligase|nr:carboxylate-amine ligase [Xanthomonadaceae bacterium]